MAQPQTDSRFFSAPSRPSRTSADQFARGLKGFSIAALIGIIITGILVAWIAPLDGDQGMRQKIFYLHVPLAIVALGGFIAGVVLIKVMGARQRYTRRRDLHW